MLGMEEEGMEYSSGCESGWTMYLDNSSCGRSSASSEKVAPGLGWESNEDEDDISMMSDASSGPALLHQETRFFLGKPGFASAASSVALTRKSESLRRGTKRLEQEKRLPWMDDTASSYDVSFSETSHDIMKWQEGGSSFSNYKDETVEDALEFSLGFSSNQLMDKKSREKKYRFFPTTSSGQATSNKPASKEVNRGKVW